MGVMLGPDPHLFLRAIAVCLKEHKVLVQRNALELLSSYMPLHSTYVGFLFSSHTHTHTFAHAYHLDSCNNWTVKIYFWPH